MQAHAAAVEEDGWDGLLFTDTQNLSMDVFGSMYLAASATSQLKLGTAVTNLVTRHPAVVASAFATLHHVSGGRAHIGVGRGDTALELIGVRPPSRSDGWLFPDPQNLSLYFFGSIYLAASATSHLKLGTAVTNLVTRHPAVVASAFATLHHVSGGRAHIGVGRGDTALELIGVRPPS